MTVRRCPSRCSRGGCPPITPSFPGCAPVDADWRLGVAATGLDRANKQVLLADGDKVPYDRLLIATGTRARPWFNPEEAKLEGVFTLRTCDDAARLQAALKARPGRVLIVGSASSAPRWPRCVANWACR